MPAGPESRKRAEAWRDEMGMESKVRDETDGALTMVGIAGMRRRRTGRGGRIRQWLYLRQGKRRILFIARAAARRRVAGTFHGCAVVLFQSPLEERAHIQHTPSFFSIPPLLFCRLCSFFFLCEGPEHGDWPFRFPILYSFWCWYSVYLNGSFIKNFITSNIINCADMAKRDKNEVS